jgi:hypothetical protein
VRTFDVHTHRPQDHSWQGGVARAKEHHHKRRAPRLVFVPGSGASQHAIERFLHGDRVHPRYASEAGTCSGKAGTRSVAGALKLTTHSSRRKFGNDQIPCTERLPPSLWRS